jgi:hypothetical protein
MEEQSTAVIRLAEQSFESVSAAKEWILTAKPQEQYDLQAELVDWVLEHRDRVEEELVGLYEWVELTKTYEHTGLSRAQHQDRLEFARNAVTEIKSRTALEGKANVMRAKVKCIGKRGKLLAQQIDLWDASGDYGKTFFAQLATIFSKSINLQQAVELINYHIWDRVSTPKRGQSTDARVKAIDLTKALAELRKGMDGITWLYLKDSDLKTRELNYGITGLLEPLSRGDAPARVPVFDDEDPRPEYISTEDPAPAPSSSSPSVEAESSVEGTSDSPIARLEPPAEMEASKLSKEMDIESATQEGSGSPTAISEEALSEDLAQMASDLPADPINVAAQALMNVLQDEEEMGDPLTPMVSQDRPKTPATVGSLGLKELELGSPMGKGPAPKRGKPGGKSTVGSPSTIISTPSQKRSSTYDEAYQGQWKKLKEDPAAICSCPLSLVERHWPQFGPVDILRNYTESELVAMLEPALNAVLGHQICPYHLDLFTIIWDVKPDDDYDLLRLRFLEIIKVMGDTMDLTVPILHYSTRTFFEDYALGLWTKRGTSPKELLKFEPETLELANPITSLGMAIPEEESKVSVLDLQWIFEPVEGIVLADIFLLELEMLLYHFKLPDRNEGFLPVYFSLAQQFMRQEPQTHRYHATAMDFVPSIAVPAPLRFRAPGCSSQGIQFFGITGSTDRLPHDDLLVTRGDPVQVEYLVPSELALLKWVTKENIRTGFVALQEWGITHYMNETLKPFHDELYSSHFKTLALDPGSMAITQDQRFVNFPVVAESNQLILSSGFVSLHEDYITLVNGMTLAAVRGWQLDMIVPSEPLYSGLWASKDRGDFPVQVPLTGLGELSDVLVGRGSWQKGGLDAFTIFWSDERNYPEWQRNAVVTVCEHWLEVVDREKKLFGANSFFALQSSKEKLDAISRDAPGKGKGKA